jgi:hypothetical protein
MSRDGSIVRAWGDEDRTFRLGIGEWRKIQETCDAGPGEIAARLATWAALRQAHPKASFLELLAVGGVGRWRVDDVREPLYRGLTGGGMDPTSAGRLVRELHDERPLMENIDLALAVVLASLVGPAEEPVGETQGEQAPAGNGARFPEESSASPATTAPVQ